MKVLVCYFQLPSTILLQKSLLDDRFMAKKAGQKRSLSFANDVNIASSKKGPAQKTPMPGKMSNGKASLPNTPLGDQKKAKQQPDAKKAAKINKQVSDEEEDFDSEMDDESFDEMGSEEEEDSLMGIDEGKP